MNQKCKERFSINDCELLTLNKHSHPNGNITTVTGSKDVPFNIKRIYYLYGVPGGEDRGGHLHKDLYQIIVSVSGSFDVTIDDSYNRKTFTLNRPYQALLLKPGIWRELNNFSSGAVTLVLASDYYNEDDYIRDYDEFALYAQNIGNK